MNKIHDFFKNKPEYLILIIGFIVTILLTITIIYININIFNYTYTIPKDVEEVYILDKVITNPKYMSSAYTFKVFDKVVDNAASVKNRVNNLLGFSEIIIVLSTFIIFLKKNKMGN